MYGVDRPDKTWSIGRGDPGARGGKDVDVEGGAELMLQIHLIRSHLEGRGGGRVRGKWIRRVS